MVAKAGAEADARPEPLSVAEACRRLSAALDTVDGGRELEVVGEVGDSHLKDHWYFTLLDPDGAKLPCSFFSTRRRLDADAVRPERGMQVLVRGRLEYWAKGGRISLIVTRIRAAGTGDLHRRYEILRSDLEARGWFDEALRLPLPSFARRILVLTSAAGAVRSDIEETARQRWPGVELLLAPIPVQGEAATPRIADAIRSARRTAPKLGVDAIVLARGGGSLEDLWCFNEEAVVRAIHESRVEAVMRDGDAATPLVSAIGHETDVTLSDFAADHRASTPTQAAMLLVPDANELGHAIQSREDRLRRLVVRGVEDARGRLERARRHEIVRRPRRLLDPHSRRLADLARDLDGEVSSLVQLAVRRVESGVLRLRGFDPRKRVERSHDRLVRSTTALDRACRRAIATAETRLSFLRARLEAAGPRSILDRGYALVVDRDGELVRDAAALGPGDQVTVELGRGELDATVDRTRDRSGRDDEAE